MTTPLPTLLRTAASNLRYASLRRQRDRVHQGRYGQPDPKCPHCVAMGLVDGDSVAAGREASEAVMRQAEEAGRP